MKKYKLSRTWNRSTKLQKKTEGLQKLKHMFCNVVFSNANLKPSELQDHFKNRHGEANI